MTPEIRLHVDRRGRVFVENATAEVMEALQDLGWDARGGEPVPVRVTDAVQLEA
jgi:hypothetical protein